MKRANEIVEGGSENSESKKARSLEEVDESRGAAARKGEEERVLSSDGRVDSEQVDKNENLLGSAVLDNSCDSSFDLNEYNMWDFDVNFGSLFSGTKKQTGLKFDLNIPFCQTSEGGAGDGSSGSSRRPVINEKNAEIINIASDDSENEVEVIGFCQGYNQNRKEIVLGMPSNRMEYLNLGLGMNNMDNAVHEGSLVSGGVRRYTREEKGKASAVDQWLSLNANAPNAPIDLNLATGTDNAVRPTVPTGALQPAGLIALSEVAVRELRREEAVRAVRRAEAARYMQQAETLYARRLREERIRAAKRFARDMDDGTVSSVKKQLPPALSSIEDLGKSPGPFSEAFKMVRERTLKGAAQQLIEWKPSEENHDSVLIPPFVPSLMDLSLKTLAENAEGIVSLELVPDNLRKRLTNMLCDMGKINVDFLLLLVKGCPTEIRIKNCSWITEPQFQEIFGNFQTKDLRVLQLDLCGQCMLDLAFRDTILQPSKSLSSLSTVSLRGACRLTDAGLKHFVASAPALLSLNLGQCSLLTSDAINYIADSLGPNLRELYIDECLKIDTMLILPAFKKFKCLEVISVASIPSITDQFVSEMITLCGQHFREIDLANCPELTDTSLKIVGSNCANLCCLNISNSPNMTDLGLEQLANGCRAIQKLRLCRNGFSDEAMAAFLESSGVYLTELSVNHMTQVGPNTAFSIAKCARKLISLDLSWCRKITNEALGLIVDSCSSLKLLKLFGCRQITDAFFKGHSNPLVRIIGLDTTPLLDHVNLLEPEY